MSLNGDGTLVGTNQNDSINAGNANDIVWGLAGSDSINAGNGNDMIDGDGKCPQGDQGQDFPHGIPGSNQCEHGNDDGQGQQDTINAGNGNDTVFGGGGHNTINVGHGVDTIYGGPLGDTINTGANGNVTIYLCSSSPNTAQVCLPSYTTSTVNIGNMSGGVVYARNGHKDTINCNGANVTVYVDRSDVTKNCRKVISQEADTNRHRHARAATHRRHHGRTKRRS